MNEGRAAASRQGKGGPTLRGESRPPADFTVSDDRSRTTPFEGRGVDHLMDWRHRSACLDEDPELFFPIGNTGPALLQIEEAKAVCRRCEVMDTCLRWALDTGQDAGVWGGLSEDERRALKRRNARARRAS